MTTRKILNTVVSDSSVIGCTISNTCSPQSRVAGGVVLGGGVVVVVVGVMVGGA